MGSQETIKMALNSIVFHHRLLSVLLIQSDLCPVVLFICASTVCLSIYDLSPLLASSSHLTSFPAICTLVPVLIFCSATTISNLALGDRSLDMSPIEVVCCLALLKCRKSVHLFSLFSNSFYTLLRVPSLFVLTVQLPNLTKAGSIELPKLLLLLKTLFSFISFIRSASTVDCELNIRNHLQCFCRKQSIFSFA